MKEAGDQIIFLRKVEPGRADRSYGIEVARLAGLPMTVIERAREILALHERSEHAVTEELTPRASAPDADPIVRAGELSDRRAHPQFESGRVAAHRSAAVVERTAAGVEALVRVAGVISGTSVDGIDVAVVDIGVDIGHGIHVVSTATVPYPPEVRAAILSVSNAATHTATIARLNFLLGELFAEALEKTGVPPGDNRVDRVARADHFSRRRAVEFLGRKIASTMQIGEAAVIAERTGIRTISDFRPSDIAAGGKGAPLVPFLDYQLFRHPEHARIALNIGGIANITVIPANAKPDE